MLVVQAIRTSTRFDVTRVERVSDAINTGVFLGKCMRTVAKT